MINKKISKPTNGLSQFNFQILESQKIYSENLSASTGKSVSAIPWDIIAYRDRKLYSRTEHNDNKNTHDSDVKSKVIELYITITLRKTRDIAVFISKLYNFNSNLYNFGLRELV